MERTRRENLKTCIVAALSGLLFVAAVGAAPVRAQPDAWSDPVNLSQSGAASGPALVTGPNGILQAFWWDQFDGIVTATYDDQGWSSPTQAPATVITVVGEGESARTISTPLETMPWIAGGSGYAQAFWRGEPDDDTGLRQLLHSRLVIGTSNWSRPRAIAEAVLDWAVATGPDESLHLLFIRAQHSGALPAGVYHMRSTDEGSSWSPPQALYETAYARLIDPDEAHLWIAIDTSGVYAAWDDPRLERSFVALSSNGGDSWDEAEGIGDPEDSTRRARVIPTEGDPLLLFEASGAATGWRLFQQRLGTPTTSAPELVLENLRVWPEALKVHSTAEGHPMLTMVSGIGALTAVAWDGERWSEPKGLSFNFTHPALGRQITLDELQTALVSGELAVLGVGQDGDVWYLQSEVEAWEWAFAPPSPWSEPVNVSDSEGVPGWPAVATDGEGRVHLLWSQRPEEGAPESTLYYARRSGDRWSRAAQVIQPPEGRAKHPVLVTAGHQLHALWNGGWSGAIYHSRAFGQDAHSPDGWSAPRALPMAGAMGASPDATIDAFGALRVVYAVPVNEGRGIYYVASDDGGETWTEPQMVFDAAAAGWAMVEHPTLAMDPAGTLHAAWVRGSAEGPFAPQGVFYARSSDGGEEWTEARAMTEGAHDWPRLAAPLPGQAHLLWNTVTRGGGWMYRRSGDYGATWSVQEQVPGFRGVAGPAGLTVDGGGTLHLIGLGRDEAGQPAVVYGTRSGGNEGAVGTPGRWGEGETFRLSAVEAPVGGAAAAVAGPQGWLSVAFCAEIEGDEGVRREVFYTDRSVPAVESGPEPVYTPPPTPTPTPSPTPMAEPTPRPSISPQMPAASPAVLAVGPVVLPLTALAGLGAATLLVVGVLIARGLWVERR